MVHKISQWLSLLWDWLIYKGLSLFMSGKYGLLPKWLSFWNGHWKRFSHEFWRNERSVTSTVWVEDEFWSHLSWALELAKNVSGKRQRDLSNRPNRPFQWLDFRWRGVCPDAFKKEYPGCSRQRLRQPRLLPHRLLRRRRNNHKFPSRFCGSD